LPHVVRTSADVVTSKVGRDLYEKFFQGYTREQWGMDPSELDKSVTSRVPTRTNKRSLFHRQLPGDAAGGIHEDV
jgi:UDP-galactopyranose mutase